MQEAVDTSSLSTSADDVCACAMHRRRRNADGADVSAFVRAGIVPGGYPRPICFSRLCDDDEERSQRGDEEGEQSPCRELDPGQRAAAEVGQCEYKRSDQVTGQEEAESLSVHKTIVVFFRSNSKQIIKCLN